MMSVCRPYGAEIVCLCDSGAGQEAGLDTVLRCTLKQEPASPSRQDSRERNATSFTYRHYSFIMPTNYIRVLGS